MNALQDVHFSKLKISALYLCINISSLLNKILCFHYKNKLVNGVWGIKGKVL